MNQQEADALRAELADVKAKLAKEEDDKKAALSKYAETDANRHIDSLVIRYEFPAGAKEKVFSKMCATDDNGRKEIAREIETCWKPKAGTSSIAGAGQIPVDTTPETDQYADTEPPIALMHQIASEKGLSFSGPQYQEIRSLAKQHMKAAR